MGIAQRGKPYIGVVVIWASLSPYTNYIYLYVRGDLINSSKKDVSGNAAVVQKVQWGFLLEKNMYNLTKCSGVAGMDQ